MTHSAPLQWPVTRSVRGFAITENDRSSALSVLSRQCRHPPSAVAACSARSGTAAEQWSRRHKCACTVGSPPHIWCDIIIIVVGVEWNPPVFWQKQRRKVGASDYRQFDGLSVDRAVGRIACGWSELIDGCASRHGCDSGSVVPVVCRE